MLICQNMCLDELLAEDVFFSSPVAFQPYKGKPIVFIY